ncbi:hypothetical protein AArcMg_0082 [Natrarchaeobaculum sulfurireducens]|uniref:Uncharacterized protein n=2 Tax=Natrarchaeobaculum sulfurireducens TaxID=2044521 RepID=A0A346PA92_9EURY|nr:hypothetical protein [Natrarchaeobaculum sulfurireducens]AXR76437.1 hypothetical protein AArc1_0083 [Natrarchaeobaculum sulfurireducens]AXR80115.1 hypothetical protein AArcMg_0082 [Natrarchaeobaculum sulfurireducens]
MMGRMTGAREVDWARVLERLLYAVPPVIGVGVVGILQDAEPGVPGLQSGLVLFGTFGYTVLTLGVAVALGLDARRVRRQPRASGSWKPSPWLNAVFGLLWAPAAGVVYLARRHRRFGTPPGWSRWWLVVALSLSTSLFGLIAAVVALVLAIPSLFTAAVGLAGAIAFGTFPIAIHQDAAYVSTYGDSWRPNPGLYLGLAFVSLFVPPLQPVLAGYYLFRRRAVET